MDHGTGEDMTAERPVGFLFLERSDLETGSWTTIYVTSALAVSNGRLVSSSG